MATFIIHEDSCSGDDMENIAPLAVRRKPKVFQEAADKTLKQFEPRVVLQPIGNGARMKLSTLVVQKVQKPPTPQPIKPIEAEEEDIQDEMDLDINMHVLGFEEIEPIIKKNSCNEDFVSLTTRKIFAEYERNFWNYMKEREVSIQRVKSKYMSYQKHLSWDMRSVLIDWLVSVGEEYEMDCQTIHLSVNYIDRFLSYISVIREKFQLVGVASMMIAGKVEEVYPPDSKEWSYLTQDMFTVLQILKMEKLMLKILQFQINPPTILDFIKHMCYQHQLDTKTVYLAMYLSELALLEGKEFLAYFPSRMAAASIALARYTLSKTPWTRSLEKTAGYSLKELNPVMQKQQKTFNDSPFKESQAIQNKYKSDKYQKVATLRPKILPFLDDDEEDL